LLALSLQVSTNSSGIGGPHIYTQSQARAGALVSHLKVLLLHYHAKKGKLCLHDDKDLDHELIPPGASF